MTTATPKCPIKLLTGYSCPACGAQRALHALTHLHFIEAIKYNLFLLIGVPYLLSALTLKVVGDEKLPKLAAVVYSKITGYTYVILFCVWWVVRNILGI